MNSDVIFVLEGGSLTESGSHDQLMELKGKYYNYFVGNNK
jgi:ABC-type multidrug transport system fused ATPase/permease subunit